jgi:hypothetical protein
MNSVVMKFDKRVQLGDILIEKRFNFWGILITWIFPESSLSWISHKNRTGESIHNGVVG